MLAFNYLVAAALLMAPPTRADDGALVFSPLPAVSLPTGVRLALQQLAVESEIMDQRETQFMLLRPDEYAADLNELRDRREELADAPPLSDAYRFPTKEACDVQLNFNRTYWSVTNDRQALNLSRAQEFQVALDETEQLYQVWDTLKDARCECYYVQFRRRALKKLRDLIGLQAYYDGAMPAAAPVWRFQVIE